VRNPIVNVIAGVLIGIANQSWYAVAIASVGWAFIASIYWWLTGAYKPLLADMLSAPRQQFWFGSASASLWLITLTVTFVVSLAVALFTYGIRQLV
jgi:hypothetical protein